MFAYDMALLRVISPAPAIDPDRSIGRGDLLKACVERSRVRAAIIETQAAIVTEEVALADARAKHEAIARVATAVPAELADMFKAVVLGPIEENLAVLDEEIRTIQAELESPRPLEGS